MLNNPFDPVQSLQLNNRHWPNEKFNNIGLISDLEHSLVESGYYRSTQLLRRCAKLLPKKARKPFLFLVARERLFRTDYGINFYDPFPEKYLNGEVKGKTTTQVHTPKKSKELSGLERKILRTFWRTYGFDIIKMHREIRFSVPDQKTKDIFQYGDLSDYHNDESKGLTTMIYLSDVSTSDGGAFQYLENSHQIPRSVVLTAAHIAVGFSLKLNDPDEMNGLPLEFRGNPGIGNFLDFDKCNLLEPTVKTVLGKKGTAWTFNGHLLLHRGGKVLKGSRTAYFLQPEGKLFFKWKTLSRAYLLSRLVLAS